MPTQSPTPDPAASPPTPQEGRHRPREPPPTASNTPPRSNICSHCSRVNTDSNSTGLRGSAESSHDQRVDPGNLDAPPL
ncbi:hypothetical protein DPM19_25760 [Actinomadura craniellae]|uniref:Uncharacterized protein n=1 Tax=Actinomadura craniellae TaxID=2231787 RepID=A0A365H0B7_9ACTN|nr:hypothetical protein DPM19_25760 [Actinomadura craniellae]